MANSFALWFVVELVELDEPHPVRNSADILRIANSFLMVTPNSKIAFEASRLPLQNLSFLQRCTL